MPVTGKARNLVSCASSHRINEEVNGRLQKYTLLIIKKLVIDLLFLLDINTISEIYKWCGSHSFQGHQELRSGIHIAPSLGHPSEPKDKGPRPAGLRKKTEPCQPAPGSLSKKHSLGECS